MSRLWFTPASCQQSEAQINRLVTATSQSAHTASVKFLHLMDEVLDHGFSAV